MHNMGMENVLTEQCFSFFDLNTALEQLQLPARQLVQPTLSVHVLFVSVMFHQMFYLMLLMHQMLCTEMGFVPSSVSCFLY